MNKQNFNENKNVVKSIQILNKLPYNETLKPSIVAR